MSLGVLDDLIQPGILAEKAISKGYGMGTRGGSLLQTFSESIHPDLNNTAILETTQGFCFYSLLGHDHLRFEKTNRINITTIHVQYRTISLNFIVRIFTTGMDNTHHY